MAGACGWFISTSREVARLVRSVANLTRRDAIEFLEIAPQVPIRPHVTTFDLKNANVAIDRLRTGKITGAAVLIPPI